MIPLREQEFIRELFRERLTGPVKLELFTQRPAPVFVPGREECATCADVQQMLEELSHLSSKIDLRVHDMATAREPAKRYGIARVPATVVRGVLNRPVVYYGLPAGYQFTLLIEIFIAVSRGETELEPATKRKLKRLKRDLPVEVFVTLDSMPSLEAARIAAYMALENGRLHLAAVELAEYPALAEELKIDEVPLTLIDRRVRLPGPLTEATLVEQVLKAAETRVVTGGAQLAGRGTPLELPRAADVERGEIRPSGLIIPRR